MEPLERKMAETPSSITVSTKLQRIATLAKQSPEMALTTLAHHIDIDWMLEAYRRTRKDGAVGVDGQTAKDYAANLQDNLRLLLNRAKSGSYKAPPVRRVYIPKGPRGDMRPIGIPTFEDKILQRAVAMILEAVYEQDFLPCSYGFRPGCSAHQALEDLRRQLMMMRGGWVLEIDIRKFFDALDHSHLRNILRRRVRDGTLLRLIGKWLNAGVLESGCVKHPESGSPQGGVISPILANAYLHEVLDVWFERTAKPRLRGRAHLIRYADDAVMVFTDENDAHRVLDVLPKRCGRYRLALHPEKTRLVSFEQPSRRAGKNEDQDDPPPGTFDLLGFTHFWCISRKGNWVVRRKTAKDRFSRSLRSIAQWCRSNRHLPIREQWRQLVMKLRGHYGYYGITGNTPAIRRFRTEAERAWRKWLSRRSRRSRIPWDRFALLKERYPLPRAVALRPHTSRSEAMF
jgi:RNA-directed DNA polymerase